MWDLGGISLATGKEVVLASQILIVKRAKRTRMCGRIQAPRTSQEFALVWIECRCREGENNVQQSRPPLTYLSYVLYALLASLYGLPGSFSPRVNHLPWVGPRAATRGREPTSKGSRTRRPTMAGPCDLRPQTRTTEYFGEFRPFKRRTFVLDNKIEP